MAMDRSLHRSSARKRFSILLSLALGAGGIAGCADIVTFSKEYHDDGMKLYANKDYANAAGAFRSATHQVPNDYQDYYYLGECYSRMGQWQQAVQSYQSCYQIMGQDGFGKQDKRLHDFVIEGWANAIASSPAANSEIDAAEARAHEKQTADSFLLLAKVYAQRGDADSAITAYGQAQRQDPASFAIAKEYGLYLEKLGQNQKAATPLKAAYALYSGDKEVTGALRRIGVVPGPSIKDEDALAKPLLPKGPIPEVQFGNSTPSRTDSAIPASSQQPSKFNPQD